MAVAQKPGKSGKSAKKTKTVAKDVSEEKEVQDSKEYCPGYRGKDVITSATSPWEVLDVVRDAMRGEYQRFDWLKFYTEFKNNVSEGLEEKRALIARYAPCVAAKMKV